MADKQTLALRRLMGKLSALRKTLRKEERELLDLLILDKAPSMEVTAHEMSSTAAQEVNPSVRQSIRLNARQGTYEAE